jgi:hypothetical protein
MPAEAHNPVCGEVRVLLRGTRRPLVTGEIHADPITHGQVCDALPDGVDYPGTVLVRSHLRKRQRRTGSGAQPRLPVGGVDPRDDDADTDLAGPRFNHIAIDEPKY